MTPQEFSDAMRESAEIGADIHGFLCELSPQDHRAIAFCACSVAQAYRKLRETIKKEEGK